MTRLVGDGDYRYEVVENWGRGRALEPFGLVSSIAVDSADRVYVFQRLPVPVMLLFDRDGTRLGSWGDDLFREPHGVWIGPDDTVFTTDTGDHTARQFTRDGTLLRTWGTPNQSGPPDQPFNRPTWAVVGPSGDLFVSDGYGQNRWHRFGADGALLGSWGRTGAGPGEFLLPHAIWVDRDSRVYVTDRTNNRVQIFSATGDYLTEWTGLLSPNQVFIDADDTVYIAEGDRRISVLTRDGTVLARWGDAGEEPGQFRDSPHSIWADSRGDLYVSEVLGEDRFQKFARQ
jgi:DNA-binding beta-propeller fold protein YncE